MTLQPIHIELPASKSISNRYLILNEVLGKPCNIENLSESGDTKYLNNALENKGDYLFLGDGGTTYRFLLAWFAVRSQNKTLDCDNALKKRPIGQLVEVLTTMGAEIEYLEKTGFPPLKIHKPVTTFSEVTVERSISSQFVSALMLAAPFFEGKKRIHLKGENNSQSFLELSANCLRNFNISVNISNSEILIGETPSEFTVKNLFVENDWASASYFYAKTALSPQGSSVNLNCKLPSIQGDSECAGLFESFGVKTETDNNGVIITKVSEPVLGRVIDLRQCIDLAPTFIVLDAILGLKTRFMGLENLQYKESNRIHALNCNLEKAGIVIRQNGNEWSNEGKLNVPSIMQINTFNDHRIAMSMALFSQFTTLEFDNKKCVEKSFPGFWEQWEKCTFA